VRVALFGRGGKVGAVLAPALETAGHELVELRGGEAEAMVDFTAPEVVEANVRSALERGAPCVVGTTGWDPEPLGRLAAERGLQLFVAPNFAIGAVLMMRLAAEAARYLPNAEIVELHGEAKKDAPSGTAKATAELLPGEPAIHSVRLPGLVAHQEVLLGGEGQLLTIRHDAYSREAYVPGVLLALERLSSLPPGLTVGLDTLLAWAKPRGGT
jgi:4-hydroxy-tetrahydrodipicolinate reductase